MGAFEEQRAEKLERMIFGGTPSDVDGRKCRAFARKLARQLNGIIDRELRAFAVANAPEKKSR